MTFLRGFLTGMSKQYNANTAAQRAEEAEYAKLDREYGYREAIQKKKDEAAAALADKQFSDDMFLKNIEFENNERLKRIEGEEKRKTERLKASLEGKSAGISFNVGVGDDGKPKTIKVPTAFDGKDENTRVRSGAIWYEQNALQIYQDLKENGTENDLQNFRTMVFNALDARMSLGDVLSKHPQTGRPTMVDKTSQYPNLMALVRDDEVLRGMVESSMIPDIDKRLAKMAGLPSTAFTQGRRVNVTDNEGTFPAVEAPIVGEFMKDETGIVPENDWKQVSAIESEGGIATDRFVAFIESAGDLATQKAKFQQWKAIDTALTPITSSDGMRPLLPAQGKAFARQQLGNQRVRNPEATYEYFLYMAANDENAMSRTIDPSAPANFMPAEQMKKMFKVDPAVAYDRKNAADRVVRMTEGILINMQAGGQIGLAAAIQKFAYGSAEMGQSLVQIGGEIINVLSTTRAVSDADQAIREQNLRELKATQQRIASGSSLDATTMITYYSTLLAYAMAVAVQGGDAAARTVSDQDVQRVAKGVAPAASGELIITQSEVVNLAVAAQQEMKEQSVVYGGYASQDMTRARASYYFHEVFGQQPARLRDLLKARFADSNPEFYNKFGFEQSSQPTTSVSAKGKSRADASIQSFSGPGPLPSVR